MLIGSWRSIVIASAAALAGLSAGCVPSVDQIQDDIDSTQMQAYYEWKAKRERGESQEMKLSGSLTIDDAIKIALQYNKQLQMILQNRDVARGKEISGYAVFLPNVTVTGGYARDENRYTNPNSVLNNYAGNVKVTQPLGQGASIPASLRSNRLFSAMTDEVIRGQVQTLVYNVADTYYSILTAQHLRESYRNAVESAEAQLWVATERRKQESATDADVLNAQVEVANYRSLEIGQKNNIDNAFVLLLKLMGASQDSEITLADKLEFMPMRPVFERAVEIASGLRPDLRQAHLDARMADEAVKLAKSAFWPALSAYFAQGWNRPNQYSGNSWTRNPWEAGVQASWDGFAIQNYGDLKQRKAEAVQKQIGVLDKQENMIQEIRLYINTLSNNEESVKAQIINQESAKEALRLAEAGYNAGVKTEVDVADARRRLSDSQSTYFAALYNHTKARLELQQAMGMLGPQRASDGISVNTLVAPAAHIKEFEAPGEFKPEPPQGRPPRATSNSAATEKTAMKDGSEKTKHAADPKTGKKANKGKTETAQKPAPSAPQPMPAQQPVTVPVVEANSFPSPSRPGTDETAFLPRVQRDEQASVRPPSMPIEAANRIVPDPVPQKATPAEPPAKVQPAKKPAFKITVRESEAPTPTPVSDLVTIS